MADLSSISDADLLALARTKESGLSAMSDEQLLSLKAKTEGKKTNADAGIIDNVVRSLARGATFGFADEIAAAGDATLGGLPGMGGWSDRYNANLTAQRGRDDAFDETSPILSGAGQMGGAVGGAIAAPVIAPFKAAGALPALGNVAANAAAGGAVAGFGEGRGGFLPRIESSAIGGALGAALGGGLHLGLNAGSSVLGRVRNVFGLRNADEAAERHLARALARDGMTPDDIAARARFAREGETILPDLGGRNITNLAAVTANTPGTSMEVADQIIQARRAAGPDRMATAVDTALGGGAGDDVANVTRTLQKARAEAAAPLYAQAHKVTLADDQYKEVSRFVTDKIGQDAMQRGLRVIELEHLRDGTKFNPADYGVKRAKGGAFELDSGTPNMRLLDAIKNGYDDIVEGYRDSTTGKLVLDKYGDRVNQVRAAYRDKLADLVPVYKEALDAWSGPSASLDAVRRGESAMRVNRDVTAAASERIAPGDRPFFELGAGRALADRLADETTVPRQAKKLITNRIDEARLATVLPDDMRRDYLTRALRREVDMADVDRAVSPRAGSQTGRLLAAGDDLGDDPAGGMIQSLLNAGTSGGMTGMTARGLSTLYRRGQGINSATADALARRLFSANPETIDATIKAVKSRALMDALANERNAAAAQSVITGAGSGSSLLAN